LLFARDVRIHEDGASESLRLAFLGRDRALLLVLRVPTGARRSLIDLRNSIRIPLRTGRTFRSSVSKSTARLHERPTRQIRDDPAWEGVAR
jgi:hypothetical protein